jgi:beta-mannosidase
VTNDTLQAVKGMVKWEICDNNSNVLQKGEEDVEIAPLSVKRLEKMYFADLDTETQHLHYALEIDGETYSDGSVLFTMPKRYQFQNPNLRYEIKGDEIVVQSDCYAKSVQIEGVDGDVLLEDNFFDMEKGERRIRILSGSASNLKLRSVFDIK